MLNAALFILLIPRNLGMLLIRGYRATISRLYGDVCRYYPSCSAYGLGSVQQRGLVVGSALTAWRILRCNPWAAGGIDEVRRAKHDRYRVTPFGWVLPAGFGGADAAATAPTTQSHAHDLDAMRGASAHRHDDVPRPVQLADQPEASAHRASQPTAPSTHRGDAVLAFSSLTMSRKD